DAFELLDDVEVGGEHHLYEASWGGGVATVAGDVVETEGAVLEARATSGTWQFRLRYHDRDGVRAFQRACIDHGTPLDIGKLYDDDMSARERYDLTEKQYVTLRTAYERGYFEDPRATDLYDLGDRLDVSPRAVSQRLRRGLSAVVSNTVVVHEPPGS
ncbi:helix-turn-helix domain-containing protein, partial [Halobium palmae]